MDAGNGKAGRRIAWAAACAIAMATAGAAALAQTPESPATVKATFLSRLAPFVDWPARTFDTPTTPLGVCIAGDDPFGAAIDQAVEGQKLGERPIVVRRLPQVEKGLAATCQILFAAGSRNQSRAQAVQAVRGAPVLTVADAGGMEPSGAMVSFLEQDGRVRFEIDTAFAAQNGLTISSKLLSLAATVRTADSRP